VKNEEDILDHAEAIGTLRDWFTLLIKRHTELSSRIETAEQKASIECVSRFSELIERFHEARERYRRRQEDTAEDFNALEVLQLTHNEVRHSMALAWLLDQDLYRLGTHAQGSLGFRLFLGEFGLPMRYADCRYWVKREVASEKSIVDIEVAARGHFVIHIENKIRASEGADQTPREWADLLRRATELELSVNHPDPPIHAFFLTPLGAEPLSQNFKPISWRRIVKVLTAFAENAKPVDVKLFAAHYAKAIERFIITQPQEEGAEHVETVVD